MTEKRSEYRQRRRQGKRSSLLGKVKSAFSDSTAEADAADEAELDRTPAQSQPAFNGERQDYLKQEQEYSRAEKSLRLKKKLDRAILLVIVLIALVLLALFYL